MRQSSAIVVGGGLAGLTAGYHLREGGMQVTLVEAAARVGGRVTTERHQGYVLDTGATQMSTGYGEYLSLCKKLGLRDQVVESSPHIGVVRHRRIYMIDARRAFSAPLLRLLGLRGTWGAMLTIKDFFLLRPALDARDVSLNHAADTESVAAYAQRRTGSEAYECLMDPLIRAYVLNRAYNVSVLEWFSALRNLGGQTMLSMMGGNDRLPLALASKIDVRLNCTATSIKKYGDTIRVSVQTVGGGTEVLSANACVLATRLPEAMSLYAPISAAAGRLGEIIKYNRGLVVQVGYRYKPPCPALGLLLGAAEHDEIGLIWLEHNKNADRAPPGHSLFSVYYDEQVNDRCGNLTDDSLIVKTRAYLEQLFPDLKEHHDFGLVTRWRLAIPHPAPGHYRELFAMKSRLDAGDPIQLAGDYLTCTGQNSAAYYGRLAAEQVLARVLSLRNPGAAV